MKKLGENESPSSTVSLSSLISCNTRCVCAHTRCFRWPELGALSFPESSREEDLKIRLGLNPAITPSHKNSKPAKTLYDIREGLGLFISSIPYGVASASSGDNVAGGSNNRNAIEMIKERVARERVKGFVKGKKADAR